MLRPDDVILWARLSKYSACLLCAAFVWLGRAETDIGTNLGILMMAPLLQAVMIAAVVAGVAALVGVVRLRRRLPALPALMTFHVGVMCLTWVALGIATPIVIAVTSSGG